MKGKIAFACAALLLATGALAAPPKPVLKDESFKDADGHRVLRESVIGFGEGEKIDMLYTHLRGCNAAYLVMLANNFHETAAEAAAAMQ